MAEQEKFKKSQVTTYNFGEGDYVMINPSENMCYGWGLVAGKHIEVNGKDFKEVEEKISKYLTDENKDYLIKASRCEEIALRIKESGLEKTTRDLGGNIRERK
jgi:hypothetical protein